MQFDVGKLCGVRTPLLFSRGATNSFLLSTPRSVELHETDYEDSSLGEDPEVRIHADFESRVPSLSSSGSSTSSA